jgi:hypothetical protein
MEVDIRETEGEYHIKSDLPGVRREDIKVTIGNNFLTITAERKIEVHYVNKLMNLHCVLINFHFYIRIKLKRRVIYTKRDLMVESAVAFLFQSMPMKTTLQSHLCMECLILTSRSFQDQSLR